MELLLKIDKEAELPKFYKQTLIDHVKKNESQDQLDKTTDKVVIFPTCFVNYNNPNLGLLTKKILNKLNIKVEFFYEGCCGMPQLEGGDIKSVVDKAKKTSETLSKYVDKGYKVLSIVPSCSLMLKYEWPLIAPENENIRKISQNTKDICEFLVDKLSDEDLKNLLKPIAKEDNVTLHISCHSRAQNIGQKATELIKLIPDIKVDVIERCSGHGGSWGVKKNNFDMAIKVGKPVARKAVQLENKFIISECPLAGTHIKQGMDKIDISNKSEVLSHPLEILAKSMNIENEKAGK